MNSLDAIRLIKSNRPHTLSAADLADLESQLRTHPEIATAVGGTTVVEAFIQAAKQAVPKTALPDDDGEADNTDAKVQTPTRKKRSGLPRLIGSIIVLGIGIFLGRTFFSSGPSAKPLEQESKTINTSEAFPLEVISVGTAGVDEPPLANGLHRIFDDRGAFISLDPSGHGKLQTDTENALANTNAIRITSGGRFRLLLDQPVNIQDAAVGNSYRYLQLAFKMHDGGRICFEFDHTDAINHPIRYDAGTGNESYGKARRITQMKLPNDWMMYTLDLADDFGAFTLRSVTVSLFDAKFAYIDHLYLGRYETSFSEIPNAPNAEATHYNSLQDMVMASMGFVADAIVRVELEDQSASGVVAHDGTLVLTAGHLLITRRNNPLQVTFQDGKMVKGKAGLVYRGLGAGVAILDQASSTEPVPFFPESNLEPGQLLVGLSAHPQNGEAPLLHFIEQYADEGSNSFRTELDDTGILPGGPVVNLKGEMVGQIQGGHRDGKIHFTRNQQIERYLKTPDVIQFERRGRWPVGSGPSLGINGQPTKEGFIIEEIIEDSPLRNTDIKVGDRLFQIDGRKIYNFDTSIKYLLDKNPGDPVKLSVYRGDKLTHKPAKMGFRRAPLQKNEDQPGLESL